MRAVTAEEFLKLLESWLTQLERPLVVAIDGRSGAGKSTLAQWLAERLDALVLAGDDFFAGGVEVNSDPAQVLAERCIDWQEQRRVLRALRDEGSARYFPFDWYAFDNSRSAIATELRARPVILLEGTYSARPELADLVDLAILVDVPDSLRMERLLAREGEIGPWERQWHRAEDWYLARQAPVGRFDCVLRDGH